PGPLNELSRGEVAEIVGGEIRQQRESDIGRRSAVGDARDRVLLIVVGRQPVVLGSDERLEEVPRLARDFAQEDGLLFGKRRAARRRGTAYPPRDARRERPQRPHGPRDEERGRT